MKLSALGEFGLIREIQKQSSRTLPSVQLGIGDDAAALTVSSNALLLATTDMLIERVHFDLSCTDFYSLGWKSAAVNVSDIAAMGGIPRFCLTSLGITSDTSVEHISEFYRGVNAILAGHKTVLVGGDTCSSLDDLIISVTLLGEVEKKQALTRAGAKAGDRIFVTGTLGDSSAGLELLLGSKSRIRKEKCRMLVPGPARARMIERHLRPIPRAAWGRKIARAGCASAMIDVSDGISSDLGHICEQSRVGAVIYSGKIPLSDELRSAEAALSKPLLHYALSGGEDYELLFTIPPARMPKLRALRIPAIEIGEITRRKGISLVDTTGRKKQLRPTGYNHFIHDAP